jgi:uncharacterized protein DUF4339
MNYMLMRDGQQYGPYTLADLQRYVAAGNVLVSDLVKSEGMDDWVPVSQVIGNIAVPVTPQPQWTPLPISPYPPPPSLHWGIVLALDVMTCGLFGWAWAIVQAVWVRKVQPDSKALLYIIIALALFVASPTLRFAASSPNVELPLRLAGIIMWLVGVFSMKASLEEHFTSAEPIGLRLSPVMTFFFNVVYFQYHFTEIAQAKKAQQLSLGQSA